MNLLNEKEEIEIEFWKNDENEKPGSQSIENIANKMQQALIFLAALEEIKAHDKSFSSPAHALELGGGQGWASCLLKKEYLDCHVTASDISPHAIGSLGKWERIFDVKVDNSFACQSYDVPVESESLDLIFTFSAAHHFVLHKETFVEANRVLKKGGKLIYMYEPVTPSFWYPLAKWRVNRKRPDIPEDLLIPRHLLKYASELVMSMQTINFPNTQNRGAFEKLYYAILTCVPVLNRLVPSTAILIFTK